MGLLALYAGGLAFLHIFLSAHLLGESAPVLWRTYKLFWTQGLAEALLAALLLTWLKRLFFRARQAYWAVLVFALHVATVLAFRQELTAPHWRIQTMRWAAIALGCGLALLVIFPRWLEKNADQARDLALAAAPWVALWVFLRVELPIGVAGKGPMALPHLFWARCVGISAVLALAVVVELARPASRHGRFLDVLVIAGVSYWLFPWRLTFELHHQSAYLGAVNDLTLGRTPLVDALCQYGVAPVYLMAGGFKLFGWEPSYHGLTFFNKLLYLFQAVAIWMLLLRSLRSRVLALTALLTVVALNRYWIYGQWDPSPYPAGGPMRFILPLVVLMAARWRLARPGRGLLGEMFLLGLASVWSLEILVFALGGYGAFTMAELWARQEGWRSWARGFVSRIGVFLFAMLCAHTALAVLTFLQSGQLPDYRLYTGYLGAYGGGIMFRWPELHSAWLLLAVLPFAGLLASMFLVIRGKAPSTLALVAGLSAMGAAQYSYFIMLAHPVNLRYMLIPGVVAGFFLLEWVLDSGFLNRACRWGSSVVGAGLAVTAILMCWPAVASEGPGPRRPDICCSGRFGFDALWDTLQHPPVLRPYSGQAVELIRKYLPGEARVTILIYGFDATHAHLLSRTTEREAYSNPDQDVLVVRPPYDASLQEGDIVIMEFGEFTRLDKMQRARLQALKKRFDLQVLERSPLGICAVRLGVHRGQGSSYPGL